MLGHRPQRLQIHEVVNLQRPCQQRVDVVVGRRQLGVQRLDLSGTRLHMQTRSLLLSSLLVSSTRPHSRSPPSLSGLVRSLMLTNRGIVRTNRRGVLLPTAVLRLLRLMVDLSEKATLGHGRTLPKANEWNSASP